LLVQVVAGSSPVAQPDSLQLGPFSRSRRGLIGSMCRFDVVVAARQISH
jgi:hypothetical protein